MSPGIVASDVAAALATVRPAYDELTLLKARLGDLKTAEEARLAHQAALEAETRELETLGRDMEALKREQRRRRIITTPAARPAPPPPSRTTRPSGPTRAVPAVVERPAPPPSADRRKLKKLVNRWQFAWSLDQSIIAQVNSIADNAERPLGEALALLEWRLYEAPIPGESEADHAARLAEWQTALASYADHLRSEIDKVETQYRSVLAIWERWRNARVSAAGLAEWNLFLDKSRDLKRRDIAALTADIQRLRTELGL